VRRVSREGALALWLALVSLSWFVGGCSFDGSALEARRCGQDAECTSFGEGYACNDGYCQRSPEERCEASSQCDDGAFCNGAEACDPDAAGADGFGCVAGSAPAVSDDVPCTEDRCDEGADQIVHDAAACECQEEGAECAPAAGGCAREVCTALLQCERAFLPQGEGCDDGIDCTADDACDGQGRCAGSPDAARCDDGAFCNGAEACDPGAMGADDSGCVAGQAPAVADELPCTVDACDEARDEITHDTAACACDEPGARCEGEAPACAALLCNERLECEVRALSAGTPCSDGFSCTINDLCNAEGMCRGSVNDAACNNAAFCDGEEFCSPGSPNADEGGCVGGVAPVVDDGIACTVDACDEVRDEVTHTPGEGCTTCEEDEDCPQPINPCLRVRCGQDGLCSISEFVAAGEGCDDGRACTVGDQCNGQGSCLGSADNARCNNGAFCDGAEICNPSDPVAGEDGCVAGASPSVDDGIDCTADACDEGRDAITHTLTDACECQADGDCAELCQVAICDLDTGICDNRSAPMGTLCDDGDPCTTGESCDARQVCGGGRPDGCDCVTDDDCPLGPCQASATCDAGACVYQDRPMGTSCGGGAACDLSACNSEGACVVSLNDAACASGNVCLGVGRCDPDTAGVEGDGCVYSPSAAGTPCGSGAACDESACDGEGVCVASLDDARCQGACRSGAACDPDATGADADGCAYEEADDGDACQFTCEGDMVAGLCQQGTCALTPEGPTGADSCGDDVDNDCDGAADEADSDCMVPDEVVVMGPASAPVGLGGAGAELMITTMSNDLPVTGQRRHLYCQGRPRLWTRDFNEPGDLDANAAYAVQGDAETVANAGANVTSGVTGEGAQGVRVCNGYGLRINPGVNLSMQGASRSVMISARMSNPATGGLGAGQYAVLSYKTNQTKAATGPARYAPLVAIGEGLDRGLRDYEFLLFNSNYGPLTLRVDVLSASGNFSGQACVFIDEISIYSIPNPPLASADNATQRDFVPWSWGGDTEDANQLFNAALAVEEFFSLRLPPAGHTFTLGREGTPFAQGNGLTWAFAGASPGAAASLPSPSLPAAVAGAETGAAARDTFRGDPLVMDFAMAVGDGAWGAGEQAHMTLALPSETLDPNAVRRLASALPRSGAPINYLSHYDAALPSQNRYYAVLPEAARPLAGRTLSLARGPFTSPTARVFLDDVSLYTLRRVTEVDLQASVGDAVAFGEPTYAATVKSAVAGPVVVRCYWQDLDDPMTVTRASDPITIEFVAP
jgi:hypothetical protein